MYVIKDWVLCCVLYRCSLYNSYRQETHTPPLLLAPSLVRYCTTPHFVLIYTPW